MTEQPITDQQLDEYDELCAAATPGPWAHTDSSAIVAPISADKIADVWEPTGLSRNGDFIETARTAMPALIAEVRRLQQQRKYLLTQLAKKDAESGRGDAALREFLASADPICGNENDGDWCELEPCHDGHHRADTAEWAQQSAAAAAGESGSTR